MSATQPPADAVVEQRHRDAAMFLFSEPDDAECRAGRLDHTQAVQTFAAFEATLRPAIIRQCAAYLDSYAGGHYMAQSLANALRELAQREEPSRG